MTLSLVTPMQMWDMPNVELEKIMNLLLETGKRTHQLWLNSESLAFIARGREYRSEFHVNPSYEIQYSLKGDLNLHYRTPRGKEEIAFVPQGSCLYQPPLVPHSPRFAPDSFQLVVERCRRPGEIDLHGRRLQGGSCIAGVCQFLQLRGIPHL